MAVAVNPQNGPSLPYHEPGIVSILILSSFLLLLNVINSILDRFIYCGLLGQILVGIAWGTPGAKWLSFEAEETVVQLGYLGLILLVYEGGLHTSYQSLKANLALSSGVALTGIAIPIGLSYTLQGLLNATPLQSFAAGAALCSTSLGTTFTVLASSGLSASRLGIVLTSAAMMDDVVGLVMVQVISNLGGEEFGWATVVRPVLVSIAFAVAVPIACLLVLRPTTLWLNRRRETQPTGALHGLLCKRQTAFVLHTGLLVSLVVGATYAGTSNLFAAYIAGATISWWDSELPHPVFPEHNHQAQADNEGEREVSTGASGNSSKEGDISSGTDEGFRTGTRKGGHTSSMISTDSQQTSGPAIYHYYYQSPVSKLLQPFFFASIGFSIPITRMFRGGIVWRGIIYTVFMAFGKFVCGLWLVRFPGLLAGGSGYDVARRLLANVKIVIPCVPPLSVRGRSREKEKETQKERNDAIPTTATPNPSTPAEPPPSPPTPSNTSPLSPNVPHISTNPAKPLSLHPPLILGLAMCARGEIGFLISGVAESKGLFSSSSSSSSSSGASTTPADPSDIFLVVTWAIVLCTMIGPLGVGLAVRRVKRLQGSKEKQREGAGRDVLGVWGVG